MLIQSFHEAKSHAQPKGKVNRITEGACYYTYDNYIFFLSFVNTDQGLCQAVIYSPDGTLKDIERMKISKFRQRVQG